MSRSPLIRLDAQLRIGAADVAFTSSQLVVNGHPAMIEGLRAVFDLRVAFPAVFARLLARFAHHGGVTWPRLTEHVAERWAFFPVLGAEWALRTGSQVALDHARGLLAAVTA